MSDETNPVIEFPVKQSLTFEEAVSLVQRRGPVKGLIVFQCDEDGDEMRYFNFGDMVNKDAVWFAEYLKAKIMDRLFFGDDDDEE